MSRSNALQLVDLLENSCPLEDTYLYNGKCVVTKCKYHTSVLESGCIAQEQQDEDLDSFTDEDLLNYKFPNSDMKVKDVGTLRRNIYSKVKEVVLLLYFLRHLKENKQKVKFFYKKGSCLPVDKILENSALRLKVMNFELWFLKYMIEDSEIKEFEKLTGTKFKIHTALGLRSKEWEAVCKHLKNANSKKGLFA